MLEDELKQKDVGIIRPRIIRAIVEQTVDTFKASSYHGYIYIDFCAKNIMLNHKNRRIFLIDIDSAWPLTLLEEKEKPDRQGQIEFWGFWNEESGNVITRNFKNAPKTVLLSFVIVWSRALALVNRQTESDRRVALHLVHNPGSNQQRPLWNALVHRNSQAFMDYFQLRAMKARFVYKQWQSLFDDLRSGREVDWQDVISSTDNLLDAICEDEARRDDEERERLKKEAEQRAEKERLWREAERIRKRMGAIESWNRYFADFRKTGDAPAARFVLREMGLDLYDDNVGEKFFEMFCYSPHNKAENEKRFLDLIASIFDAHQLQRYKAIIKPMADIFSENSERIKDEIEDKIEASGALKSFFLNSMRDVNINQGVKEDLARLRSRKRH